MTVADLRSQLDALERNWSEQDLEVLGEFKDQTVYVDVFGPDGKFAGIGQPNSAYFDACFGVMLMANYNERRKA